MVGRKAKKLLNEVNYKCTWRVAVYCRLSSDDGDNAESDSIKNQRELISLYLKKENDVQVVDYYIDDGYSGTTFNRPDFKRMIKDMLNEKINTIIVKDLSRFGRDYIEAGMYLEQTFPLYNIRFIAINDNVDSFKDPKSINNVIVPFKNLMNDEYARDISNKVRSILNTKKESGQFIGSFAPFGYIRDSKDVHKFIIDEKAAVIVKKIFKMALDGKSKKEIIDNLNAFKVPTPALYKAQFFDFNYKITEEMCTWDNRRLDDIIRNKTYIGTLEQGKRKKISHKVHKEIEISREDWISIPNHHKAIIKESDFYKVQSIIYNRDKRVNVNKEYDLFTGYIRCADCGNTLTKRKGMTKNYYYCTSYIRNKQCSRHSCQESQLEEIVLKAINSQIKLALDIENAIETISQNSSINYDYEILNNKLEEIENRKKKYIRLREDLKDDLISNELSESDYLEYREDYNNKLKKIDKEIKSVSEKLKKIGNNCNFNKEWLKDFQRNKEITKLNNKIINELIDSILVKENGEIIIRFKYEDRFMEALNFIKNNKVA